MKPNIQKKYNYWQWRTLIVLMVGYIMYYFVRKNLSAALPAMEVELGISKVHLGVFLTLNGVVYGLSRFVNGYLADRYSRKTIMALGLALSALINFAICFSPALNGVMHLLDAEGKATIGLISMIGSLWVINGYVQGMGVPPCASLMARWIRPSELATKQSIWNASHSIGAGLVVALCGWMISRYGYSAWNLCFAVPAALAIVGAFVIYFGLKDTPSSVGLPEIEDMSSDDICQCDNKTKDEGISHDIELKGSDFKIFVNRMVFKNPIIWVLALANFCVYVIRFTILDWGTSFLTQYKGFDIGVSSSIVAASEILGGVVGTLVAGWITDKYMGNRAHRTCFIFSLGATICMAAFWFTPSTAHWLVSAIFICMAAFFIYGPQALLGVCASQQSTKRVCATANGILGIFGYASTAISGIGFGWMSDAYGWNAVFVVAICFGVLASVVIGCMWKVPADGYSKADRVLEELNQL